MPISWFSFFMAVLWFSIFTLLLYVFSRRTAFILRFGLLPLFCLIVTSLVRLLFSYDFRFSKVISSYKLIPALESALQKPLLAAGGAAATGFDLLVALWLSVAAILLLRLLLRYVRLARTVRRLPRADLPGLRALLARAGIPGAELAFSERTGIPFMTGFFRPVAVLPARDYDEDALADILAHEARHFLSHDLWIKLLVNLVCCVFWWNPASYLLRRVCERTMELRCDGRVSAQFTEEARRHYFGTILSFYRDLQERQAALPGAPVCAASFVVPEKDWEVLQRFRFGLRHGRTRNRLTAAGLCAAVLLLFLASYAVIFQPAYPSPTEEDGYEIYTVTLDGSYLVKNPDGTYNLFIDGEDKGTFKSIAVEPFASMPIKNGD